MKSFISEIMWHEMDDGIDRTKVEITWSDLSLAQQCVFYRYNDDVDDDYVNVYQIMIILMMMVIMVIHKIVHHLLQSTPKLLFFSYFLVLLLTLINNFRTKMLFTFF